MMAGSKFTINEGAFDELNKQFADEKKCPFTKTVGYFNKFTKYLTPDKMPKVTDAIASLIQSVFVDKRPPAHKTIAHVGEGLNEGNAAKLYKYLYDVVYLQEELYPELQAALSQDIEIGFEEIINDSKKLNLQNVDTRELRAIKFLGHITKLGGAVIEGRDKSKKQSNDPIYDKANEYALTHSEFAYNKEFGFVDTFHHGINDGASNLWSLVGYIPELFNKKYNRYPTTEEYRAICDNNIDSVIIPLASISMNNLVYVVHTTQQTVNKTILNTADNSYNVIQNMPNNNLLDVNSTDFRLDENDKLQPTESYMQKRATKLDIQKQLAKIIASDKRHYASFNMNTGCPALQARTKDGNRVVKDFSTVMLSLLDKVYFPYWEK